ncbi:HrpE/YscL family type III secretion apparatus protein [Candidatus Chlamydia sanziniae]|uniref:Flagellar assembly protein FliH n=1 Tax=Candidatus Chlamydia sanziniae TaxID=1806891 RepID=A0A1A9HXI0_9CHLA|nr:HrpE/YscL family type III secretion apparatus protein [Candidatus Chlamydia sanziniae]ANH78626.1 Type III secretion translocase SctL [Candidatus Chlamydia sanziniae]
MKFFSLIFKHEDISPNKKVLAPEAFSSLLDVKELLDKTKSDSEAYVHATEEECVKLRQEAKEQGFKEGNEKWNKQLALLEQELHHLREKIRDALVPLAIASVKKIIGKELEMHPETIVSIISEALKELTQNKTIIIYLNPKDLPIVEKSRPELKKIVEYANALILSARPDVVPGGCIIETEAGIINAQLDVQLAALEKAFSTILKQKNLMNEPTPTLPDSPPPKNQATKE